MSEVVDRELERAIELANNAVDAWLELLEECEIEFGNRTMRERMIRIIAEACAESFARPFHDPGLINLKTVVDEIERLREEMRPWLPQPYAGQYTQLHTTAAPYQQVSGTGYSQAVSGSLSVGSHSHTINAADTNVAEFSNYPNYATKQYVDELLKQYPPSQED